MISNKNGITIKELKQIINSIPETDENGEDYEVWIESGLGLYSIVTYAGKLNHRHDGSDLILKSSAYKVGI